MRRRKKTNKRNISFVSSKITSKVGIIVVGLLIIFQIFNTIQTSSSGAVLADLEREERELIKSTQELESKIVDKNSLLKIKQNSEELGYYSPQNTFYITDQDTVALLK